MNPRDMILSTILVIGTSASAEIKSIKCQYGQVETDSVTVVEVSEQRVIFTAQDDDVSCAADFTGTLIDEKIGSVVEIQAQSRGREARRFLRIQADTAKHTLKVELSEIGLCSFEYLCKAIHIAF